MIARAGREDRPTIGEKASLPLELRGIRKTFPGVVALHEVDLVVGWGEVHGIVGENGAGKSTLIKIAAGALLPDAGTVKINGRRVVRASPSLALKMGMAVIHQDRQIAPDVSVAENLFLGNLPATRLGIIKWRKIWRRAEDLLAEVGLEVDLRRPAGELSIAEQQELEVARAVGTGAKIFIMDEPTAALGGAEIASLFDLVRKLRASGKTVVYISHHLEEIFEIADSVTIMRDGSIIRTQAVAEATPKEVVSLMFGRDIATIASAVEPRHEEAAADRDVVLEAQDLRLGTSLRGVSLTLRRGELLCVTGSIGSGRRELARCLGGAQRPERGQIRITGHAGSIRTPRSALKAGVAYLSDDRKGKGVFPDLDLIANIDIAHLSLGRSPFALGTRQSRRRAAKVASDLSMRYSQLEMPAIQLSGGNQQKLLLGRWLSIGARILVLDEPTAGVDVSAKVELYDILRTLNRRGIGLIVFSSDYEEIKLLADRLLVMKRGEIISELPRELISAERLFDLE